MELAICIIFIGLQAGAKALPHACGKVAHWAIIQRISRHHWIVWLGHPVIWHGIHEYVVHFIIYSGYVIGPH